MRGAARALVAAVLTVAGLGVMAGMSQVTWPMEPRAEAELRLTWRARASQEQECRRLTDDEQAALPAHMRRDEICEGRVASYRLEVRVDGELRHESTVRGAGARGDRPLYVLETIRLDPGLHHVEVTFERADRPAAASADEPRTGAVPDRLELSRTVSLGAGDVALVTYDATARRLVVQ